MQRVCVIKSNAFQESQFVHFWGMDYPCEMSEKTEAPNSRALAVY